MVASDDEELIPLVPDQFKKGAQEKPQQQSQQIGGLTSPADASNVSNAAVGSQDPHVTGDGPGGGGGGGPADATRKLDQFNPIHQVARVQAWISLLFDTYGWKLCVVLILSQHVLKGFCFSFLATSLDFIFKFYSITGPRIQIYKSVALCPWSLKPLFGIISDKFPLFGYHKTSYMVIVTLLAMCSMGYVGVLGLLYYDHSKHSVEHDDITGQPAGNPAESPLREHLDLQTCVICFFIGFMQISVCDLLTEARYAQSMREVGDGNAVCTEHARGKRLSLITLNVASIVLLVFYT